MRERIEVMKRLPEQDGMRYPRDTCEGCFKQTDKLQCAHIFGRRSIIGEPWASSRYLTAKLCYYDPFEDKIGCHEKIDRYIDKDLRDRLERIAVERLYDAFIKAMPDDRHLMVPEDRDPAGAVRMLVDRVNDADIIHSTLHLHSWDGVIIKH